MKRIFAIFLFATVGCGQSSTDIEPRRPPQAGQALSPATTAARIAAIQGAAISGDQDAVREQMNHFNNDFRRSIKLADPARAVDREGARNAARLVPGVRSVVWVDRENMLAIVERNEQRSQSTINAICLQLDPLGDTLGVVVNLQSGAARTGDELEILGRNCQLAPGERAMLQANRMVDVLPPEVRREHKANQTAPRADRDADEAIRLLEASTPSM